MIVNSKNDFGRARENRLFRSDELPAETFGSAVPWVVMKFGGRSVSSVTNWQTIARLVRERLEEGVRPVIVHSALFGVSNLLIKLLDVAVADGNTSELIEQIRSQHESLANHLAIDPTIFDDRLSKLSQIIAGVKLVGEVSPRVHARVLAFGELMATELGAIYLNSVGIAVHWMDARNVLKSTSQRNRSDRSHYMASNCDSAPDSDLQAHFASIDGVVLTQGFIARNHEGETVLLGRGGSDTSGAYLAGKLEARRLEVWTDVPGFFTADPRSVPTARLIKRLDYRVAQEIASAGGGILHPRSISPVRSAGIPLLLKCTDHPEWEGSIVSHATANDVPHLKAISHRQNLAVISMESLDVWHRVEFLPEAFDCFRKHGIAVDLISTTESSVTVSVDLNTNVCDVLAIEDLAMDLQRICRVMTIPGCAAIAIIGCRIRSILHKLESLYRLFQNQTVHLVSQSPNDLNLSFVVDAQNACSIVQQLHELLEIQFESGIQDDLFGSNWEQLINRGTDVLHEQVIGQ